MKKAKFRKIKAKGSRNWLKEALKIRLKSKTFSKDVNILKMMKTAKFIFYMEKN